MPKASQMGGQYLSILDNSSSLSFCQFSFSACMDGRARSDSGFEVIIDYASCTMHNRKYP